MEVNALVDQVLKKDYKLETPYSNEHKSFIGALFSGEKGGASDVLSKETNFRKCNQVRRDQRKNF